jgi:hypothetical protein
VASVVQNFQVPVELENQQIQQSIQEQQQQAEMEQQQPIENEAQA